MAGLLSHCLLYTSLVVIDYQLQLLAIEEINNAGGINGQQLELVVYDDKRCV